MHHDTARDVAQGVALVSSDLDGGSAALCSPKLRAEIEEMRKKTVSLVFWLWALGGFRPAVWPPLFQCRGNGFNNPPCRNPPVRCPL